MLCNFEDGNCINYFYNCCEDLKSLLNFFSLTFFCFQYFFLYLSTFSCLYFNFVKYFLSLFYLITKISLYFKKGKIDSHLENRHVSMHYFSISDHKHSEIFQIHISLLLPFFIVPVNL